MKTFPMFLRMADRRVVIAGGGEQAAQKCRLMLKTEARIQVLAPRLDPELHDLHRAGRIEWLSDRVTAKAFENTALVFVATGCPGTDAALHALAKQAGAVVNVVDQPDLCDAITPSIVDRDPVVVAIGTEGTAPVLARQIKTRMEEILEPGLGDLAALAGRLRGQAAARLGPRMRRDLWRWVFNGPVRDTHARGAERAAAEMIKQAISTAQIPAPAPSAVALVGAGPGSADLITLRGIQRLQEADIIFYDRLIAPDLLELARRDAERVYVGKAPGCHSWPQDKICDLLVAAARQGKRVVRLKCGDPGIFARGAEEAEALTRAGIAYEIVPGVTAASACAASIGGFLTERHVTDTLVLTTGRCENPDTPPDWAAYLRHGSKVAIYMGINAAPDIERAALHSDVPGRVMATIVSNSGSENSRHVRCEVRALVDTIKAHGLQSPAIIFLEVEGEAIAANTGAAQPAPMALVR